MGSTFCFHFLREKSSLSSVWVGAWSPGYSDESNVLTFFWFVVLMDDYQALLLLSFPYHDVLCIRFSTTKIVARMAVKYFSFALPLILLCKFTTSGDLARAHHPACLHIFFIVFGCSCSFFKNNPCPLGENNLGHLLHLLAFSLLVLFRT